MAQARATSPHHSPVHVAWHAQQHRTMMQCDNQRDTVGAKGECSPDEPLLGAIQDAVTAAVEGGASIDEIVAGVRARRCARARPAEGRWAERMDGLICLQRETVRFAEEWERTREPGAEGLSALIAIETLRTLALCTMAELGAREEPVPTEDLGRLALALHRIESADRLRIEREQAAADAAAAHDGPAARAAGMTHAERVETVRRAMEGTSSLGAQSRRRRHSGGPPPLPRTLPSPCRSRSPIRLPPRLPRIHVSPRRNRRPIRLPTTGRRMYGTRAERRIYVTRTERPIYVTRA